jgi:DNA-directed RNA polymerase subunit RPC12/RpoP
MGEINMVYDQTKYKTLTWKNFTMLHWMINPGLAINELFLGQRIPKVILFEKDNEKPLMERQYIPCPHCGHLNNGLLWSRKNAFRNWFGYYCPNCGKIIPCLWNFTSLILLLITIPLWIWFVKSWKQKWLVNQPSRFENFQVENIKHQSVSWVKSGLAWGGFMFVFMSIIFPLIDGEGISAKKLMFAFPFWLLAGIGFGYFQKYLMGKKEKKAHSKYSS